MGRTRIVIVFFLGVSFASGQTTTKTGWYNLYTTAYPIDSAAGSNTATGSQLKMWKKATSGGEYQEHYYLAYNFSGIVNSWRGNGQEIDLWRALKLVYLIKESAVLLSGSIESLPDNVYKGWPSLRTVSDLGMPLWESYFWRYATNLLRVIYQSPNLRASDHNGDSSFPGTTYQDVYNDLLTFVEKHLYEKYDLASSTKKHFYRSRIHMDSHWALIAMNLHIMTQKSKYLTLFNNLTHSGFPSNTDYPSCNFRANFYKIGNNNYSWYQTFSTNGSGDPGTKVQDLNHAEAVYVLVTEAYEAGYYWTSEDVQLMGNGLMNVVWDGSGITLSDWTDNVDGSGSGKADGNVSQTAIIARYHNGFYNLMSNEVSNISDVPNTAFNKRVAFLGNMVLAQAVRDGTVSYPESQGSVVVEKIKGKLEKKKITSATTTY